MAQQQLGLDPHSGVIVVFRSKCPDRIKILVFDGTGLVLVAKRLEEGKFAWPAIRGGVMRLSRAPFEALAVRGARCSTGSSGSGSVARGGCAGQPRRSDSPRTRERHRSGDDRDAHGHALS
jgi:hypothetical protein